MKQKVFSLFLINKNLSNNFCNTDILGNNTMV